MPKSTKTNHQKVESRTKKDKKYQDISKGVKMFLKSLVFHDKRSNIQYNDVIKKYTDNVIYQIYIVYDRVSDVVENGVSFASKILTHNRMH